MLTTPRLTLIPTSIQAMQIRLDSPAPFDLGGIHYPAQWPADALALFSFVLALPPETRPWDFTVIQGSQAIGQMGFKSLPEEGQAEIGYGLNPEMRGHGYATEALQAVCGWAARQGLQRVLAETLPSNAASARVLQKCGFIQTGQRLARKDGLLLQWSKDLP